MLKIKELREQNRISQNELAKQLNLTNKNICSYETGVANPKIETLIDMANFFNCSIDYLVGRESEDGIIVVSGNELSKDEEHLIEILRQLNPADKDMVYRVAEMAFDVAKND